MLGEEEEEGAVASPLPGGLGSPVSLASHDEDNSPISGGASASPSPLAAAKRQQGKKNHGKSGSTSMDTSPGNENPTLQRAVYSVRIVIMQVFLSKPSGKTCRCPRTNAHVVAVIIA